MSNADIYHGNTARLVSQLQDSILAVPGVPAGQLRKFDRFTFGRNPVRSDNNTVRNKAVMNKRDETDERPSAALTGAFCLNEVGFWLTMLLGQPVTTGDDPGPYTHVWTWNKGLRPTALMEAIVSTVSGGASRRRRGLGFFLNQLNWDPMAEKQQLEAQFLVAQEVLPAPVADFDGAVAFLPLSMAATHRAHVYDVNPNSTLGDVTAITVAANLNATGVPLANGQRGYGAYIVGDQTLPSLGGSLTGLFRNAQLWDHAAGNISKPMTIVTANADNSHSLTIEIPKVGFSEPEWEVGLEAGKMITCDWYYHDADGDSPATFTLINGVASYT